jgi:hypothetical protein
VALLRSQAADVRLLANQSSGVPQRFASAHAAQLAQSIDSARKELAALRPANDALAAMKKEALDHALALDELARAPDVAATSPSRSVASASYEHQRALEAIEQRLQR